jgi:CubicO group peptidase (beta-lactamase class C family)
MTQLCVPGLKATRRSPVKRWRQVRRAMCVSAGLFIAGSAFGQSVINPEALDRLFAEAQTQQTHALFVYQKGVPVRSQLFEGKERRIDLYSITKAFAGLAIGIAWDKGLIPSIEEPLGAYFPEANADPLKRKIKIRHLLQHTSGIYTTPGSRDIYAQRDFVKFALESEVVSTPGEIFNYNNRAVNLLSGIIGKASHESMEKFIVQNIFRPLDIRDYSFEHDRAGNTWAMDRLQLKASDLVKVSCVLADGGRWQGKQIISEKWLAVASQVALVNLGAEHQYSLCLIADDLDSPLTIPAATVDELEKAGLTNSLVIKLRSLQDQTFKSDKALGQALRNSMSAADLEAISTVGGREMIPLYRNLPGIKMLSHSGEIGERMVAVTGCGIAVARTINDKGNGGFDDMNYRVFQLLPPVSQPAP